MATRSTSQQQVRPKDARPSLLTADEVGLVWITCGRTLQVAVIGIALLVVAPKWHALNKHSDLASVVTCIIVVGIYVGIARIMLHTARKWVQHGRKLRTDSVEELLRKDPRPAVLYLRPFAIDSTMKHAPLAPPAYVCYGPNMGFYAGPQVIMRTEEEQMVHVFKSIGPVIAIGKPGDSLPELGAARRYLQPGEDWQGLVKAWMAQAAVVVLHAGTTQGLLWELQTARDTLAPEQLLILLSMNDEEYLLFKKEMEDRWSIRFPSNLGRPIYGSIRGCMYFKSGWNPSLLEMEETPSYKGSYTPLAPILERTLQPFLDQFEQVSAKANRVMQENVRITQERATKSQELSRRGHITEHDTRTAEQLGERWWFFEF
jgi:hypothetical protein